MSNAINFEWDESGQKINATNFWSLVIPEPVAIVRGATLHVLFPESLWPSLNEWGKVKTVRLIVEPDGLRLIADSGADLTLSPSQIVEGITKLGGVAYVALWARKHKGTNKPHRVGLKTVEK